MYVFSLVHDLDIYQSENKLTTEGDVVADLDYGIIIELNM